MDILWLFAWLIIGTVILALLKRLWLGMALWVFGWKPSILDEKQMARTVKDCTAQFVQSCGNITEEQADSMSESEKRMLQEDIERYTRFVIKSYVENYLLSK